MTSPPPRPAKPHRHLSLRERNRRRRRRPDAFLALRAMRSGWLAVGAVHRRRPYSRRPGRRRRTANRSRNGCSCQVDQREDGAPRSCSIPAEHRAGELRTSQTVSPSSGRILSPSAAGAETPGPERRPSDFVGADGMAPTIHWLRHRKVTPVITALFGRGWCRSQQTAPLTVRGVITDPGGSRRHVPNSSLPRRSPCPRHPAVIRPVERKVISNNVGARGRTPPGVGPRRSAGPEPTSSDTCQ